MRRAGIRSVALLLLVCTLPMPYYSQDDGAGVVTWLALCGLTLWPLTRPAHASGLALGLLQIIAYAVVLWAVASYAAARLTTVGSTKRPRIGPILSLALVAIAFLPIYTTAGAKPVWMSAVTLQTAILVFMTTGS